MMWHEIFPTHKHENYSIL